MPAGGGGPWLFDLVIVITVVTTVVPTGQMVVWTVVTGCGGGTGCTEVAGGAL